MPSSPFQRLKIHFICFHSKWVISDYHSFVWQFEFPWLNLTNCQNKWMVIRNDPLTVKHTKWIFTDVGNVMMAFILATDFDFIAYMSKMAFFWKLFSRQWRFWNMIGFNRRGIPHHIILDKLLNRDDKTAMWHTVVRLGLVNSMPFFLFF